MHYSYQNNIPVELIEKLRAKDTEKSCIFLLLITFLLYWRVIYLLLLRLRLIGWSVVAKGPQVSHVRNLELVVQSISCMVVHQAFASLSSLISLATLFRRYSSVMNLTALCGRRQNLGLTGNFNLTTNLSKELLILMQTWFFTLLKKSHEYAFRRSHSFLGTRPDGISQILVQFFGNILVYFEHFDKKEFRALSVLSGTCKGFGRWYSKDVWHTSTSLLKTWVGPISILNSCQWHCVYQKPLPHVLSKLWWVWA